MNDSWLIPVRRAEASGVFRSSGFQCLLSDLDDVIQSHHRELAEYVNFSKGL